MAFAAAALLAAAGGIGFASSSRVGAASMRAATLTPIGIAPRVPIGLEPLGALSAQRELSIAVALRPRNPVALHNYVSELAQSGSPTYHRYLTPGEFASEFAPSMNVVNAVERLLRAAHLQIGKVAENHLVIPVRGHVSQLERAFHTRLLGFRERDGELGWEAAGAPRLAREVASSVSAVVGLNNVLSPHALSFSVQKDENSARGKLPASVPPVAGAPSACSAALATAKSGDGWTEDQIAQAYGLNRLYAEGGLGEGQTIDVLELEPYKRSDLASFDQCFFGASHTAQMNAVHVDGFNALGSGSGEALLDVEVLSALAPKATIDVYEAPNTSYGAIDAYDAMVSSDNANVISSSWGECETDIQLAAPGTQQVENYLFEEAAAQGQTVFAASGDTGSDDCAGTQFHTDKAEPPYLSVDDPASQPDVVGVGGTSLLSDSQPLGIDDERAWNDGPNGGGGGGGISDSWASPAWQADSGVPGIANPTGRLVPDVSADADEDHGITIYQANPQSGAGVPSGYEGWQTIGGTSGAAPIWAAIVADIASSGAVCPGLPSRPGGADLGFVAPELYAVASTDYSAAFDNVIIGNNDVYRLGLGYSATPGFNLTAGLGSPNVTNPSGPGLAQLLCQVATSRIVGLPDPVTSGLSPSAVGPTSGGNTVTIAGSGFQPTANAKVAVSFGSAVATVQSVSATSLTVTVPTSPLAPASATNAAAGTVDVVVTVSDAAGTSSSATSLATQYQYVDEQPLGTLTPSVSGIGPSGGNVSGGNQVAIYGSGFAPGSVERVTFGGIPAESFTVVRADMVSAVVPPESSTTACAGGIGFEPTTVCQVEVVVTTTAGASATDPILPSEVGPVVFGPQGVYETTRGFESAPASTEYDYAPSPAITSISPSPTPPSGQSPIVINGSGFSLVTFDWVNFGPPKNVASQALRILSISPTEITIRPPGAPASDANPTSLPGGVSVETASGVTNVAQLFYAGTPQLENLSLSGGSTRGGTRLQLDGLGLGDVTSVAFVGELEGAPSVTVTTSGIRHDSATKLDVVTPPHASGPVAVVPCSAAGCAHSRRNIDTFVFYSPSGRTLSGFAPSHGGADGGTVVTVFGKDVSSAGAVRFGRNSSTEFVQSSTYSTNDPDVIAVVSPPGPAREMVAVSVAVRGGRARLVAPRRFRYEPSTPSAPADVTVSNTSSGLALSWRPPLSDGGSSLTGYVITATTRGSSPETFRLSAKARSFELAKLSPRHTYELTVAATNADFGRGPVSTTSVTIPG